LPAPDSCIPTKSEVEGTSSPGPRTFILRSVPALPELPATFPASPPRRLTARLLTLARRLGRERPQCCVPIPRRGRCRSNPRLARRKKNPFFASPPSQRGVGESKSTTLVLACGDTSGSARIPSYTLPGAIPSMQGRRERESLPMVRTGPGSAAPTLASLEQLVRQPRPHTSKFCVNGSRYEEVDSGRVLRILPHPADSDGALSLHVRVGVGCNVQRPLADGAMGPITDAGNDHTVGRSPWTLESRHPLLGFGDLSTWQHL